MPHAPDLQGCALDGRYEIQELIGEGTFGRVYRGHDRRLERAVAIKVIKPWWAEDPEWVESFGREAQLLARVSDPGIVQIYDVGQAEEGLYYVTELVEGESLAGRLRRGGRMEPWEACDIAEQLCRALEHAHDEQIVHRDIKPANVLISSRGKVKVGDLGIARLAEGTTEGGTATIVGTPRYMAPEQASGLPVTPATDVYSVGIVLYEMLAGYPPFNGESAVEIALRHVQDAPAPLPHGTPGSLERIARRALAKQASERYESAAAMADALARARTRAHDETLVTQTLGTLRRGSNDAEVSNGARVSDGAGLLDGAGVSDATDEHGPMTTWVAPRYSPRHNVNPAARRRAVAAFVLAAGVLGLLALAAATLTGRPTVTLPQLHGLTESRVNLLLHRRHLSAAFTRRYDARARLGTVVAQTPGAGARVKQDSTIDVALSRGPSPVEVPSLTGQSSGAAVARLHRLHLEANVLTVAAPGTQPGVVTAEAPRAGHHLQPSQTVTLSVAETPRWQTVTTFQGGRSGPFRIHGSQWRVVYTMAYNGSCNLVFFCNGPGAQVVGPGGNVSFDLNDGGTQTRVFKSGPGVYQISIGGGWDSAHWSVTVEDWY